MPSIPVSGPPPALSSFWRKTTVSSSVSLRSGCQNTGGDSPPFAARSGSSTNRPSASGCIQLTASNGRPVVVSWCVHLPSAKRHTPSIPSRLPGFSRDPHSHTRLPLSTKFTPSE